MELAKRMARNYPDLKKRLTVARIEKTPEQYVEQNLKSAFILTVVVTFGALLFIQGLGVPIFLVILVPAIVGPILFFILMHIVDVEVRKYAREIDRDVLFAGRFLLIKLNSGKPLISAISDASNSYGVANKYFKEIVKDIELGTPLEDALDRASRYCPSEKMRRILFQITNALNIGVDVTNFLNAILDEIAQEQLVEIQKYGRKLSGITMFYMLFAIVIPSLGITMFITVISLVNIQADFGLFIIFLFALILIEFAFITIFKSIRPNVNI